MSIESVLVDWPEVSELLDEALDLPAEKRDEWLSSLGGARLRHRDTLARLLRAQGGMETNAADHLRLDRRSFASERPDAAAPVTGDLVGPYVLREALGQGGMGEVWLGERADAMPRRKVAIKLPHLGWSPALGERLNRERDILASLEHPNIARLYDAGVDGLGRPYLALEYVDGLAIDRWCREHAAPLRQRLALLLQVAAAVAHAHTRLVVHRDLKPSNILVAADGSVRLLDFGIAKLMQDDAGGADLTRMTGQALTPGYASPEQLRGEAIGTASDVFSLGVVAYELLAERRPYELKARGADALIRGIAAITISPPSRVAPDPSTARQLAGDLDAILLRALKLDPVERYPTVAAFADDIKRHLARQPVQARPDSLSYRLRRFVARNRVQALAGSIALAAVVAGAGVALWQATEARREAARAQQVKAFALSIFKEADTDSGASGLTTVADLLKAAEARIDNELKGSPEVAVEMMTAVSYGLLSQGRTDDARRLLKRAVELSTARLGASAPLTVSAGVVYGEALVGVGEYKQAIALLEKVAVEARRQNATHELVAAYRWMASALGWDGNDDAAIAAAREAVAALESPGERPSRLDALEAWQTLGDILNAARRVGGSAAGRQALALAQELYGNRLVEQTLAAREVVAGGLFVEGRLQEAIAEQESILSDRMRVFGMQQARVAVTASTLGTMLRENGDLAGAADAYRTAVAARRASSPAGDPRAATEQLAVANVLADDGRPGEALREYEAVVEWLGRNSSPRAPLLFRANLGRASSLLALGRIDEADRLLGSLGHPPSAGGSLVIYNRFLARLRSRQGRHDEALRLARAADTALTKEDSPLARARGRALLGTLLLAADQADGAVRALEDAAALYAKTRWTESSERKNVVKALAAARERAAARAARGGPVSVASGP